MQVGGIVLCSGRLDVHAKWLCNLRFGAWVARSNF